MSEFCEHETFRDICGICHRDKLITALRAEINEAQKREACAFDLSREWEAHCKTAEAQRDSLRAENERLRAELEAICMMDISWVGDAWKLKDIARAALGEKQ